MQLINPYYPWKKKWSHTESLLEKIAVKVYLLPYC